MFSRWVVSDSLWPHEPQHTRLPCSLLSPRVCSNSCPLSWWCHLTISSSVIPFSSFLASGSFPVSQFFTLYWSFSISPSNEYSEFISFRIDWFDLLAVQETLKSLLHSSKHHSSKTSILWLSAFFMVQLSHHIWLWKNHIVKVMKWEMRCKSTKHYFLSSTEQKGAELNCSQGALSSLRSFRRVSIELVNCQEHCLAQGRLSMVAILIGSRWLGQKDPTLKKLID